MPDFVTTFPKEIIETVILQYFKNLGILSEQTEMDIKKMELSEDGVLIEADLSEKVLN